MKQPLIAALTISLMLLGSTSTYAGEARHGHHSAQASNHQRHGNVHLRADHHQRHHYNYQRHHYDYQRHHRHNRGHSYWSYSSSHLGYIVGAGLLSAAIYSTLYQPTVYYVDQNYVSRSRESTLINPGSSDRSFKTEDVVGCYITYTEDDGKEYRKDLPLSACID